MTDPNNNNTSTTSTTTTTTTTTTKQYKPLHLDDIIIKCLEEIALNGSRGMTPDDLFTIVQDTFGPINIHLKNYIHARILDHKSIYLIDGRTSTQVIPFVEKSETHPMSLLKKVGGTATEEELVILSAPTTPIKQLPPPTPSSAKKKAPAKKAPATPKSKATPKKKQKEEEEEEEEERDKSMEDSQIISTTATPTTASSSKSFDLPDNSVGFIYQVDTLETPKKATTLNWSKQNQQNIDTMVVIEKDQCKDWQQPATPFAYVADKDLRRKACGIPIGESQFNEIQTKIIEAVAYSRKKGIAQSELSDMFGIDPRNIFNPIKFLHVKGYIVKCEVFKSGPTVNTRMIYLTHFFNIRDPLKEPWRSKTITHETISDYLLNQPEHICYNGALRIHAMKNCTLGVYKATKKAMIADGYLEAFKCRVDTNGNRVIGTEIYSDENIYTAASNKSRKKPDDEFVDDDDDDEESSKSKKPKRTKEKVVAKLVDFVKLLKPFDPLVSTSPEDKDADDEDLEDTANPADGGGSDKEPGLMVEGDPLHQMFRFIKNSPKSVFTSDIQAWMGPNYSAKYITSGLRSLICYYKLRVVPIIVGKVMSYKYYTDDYQLEHVVEEEKKGKEKILLLTATPTKTTKEVGKGDNIDVSSTSTTTTTTTSTTTKTPSKDKNETNVKQPKTPSSKKSSSSKKKTTVTTTTDKDQEMKDIQQQDDTTTTTSTTSTITTPTKQIIKDIKLEEELEANVTTPTKPTSTNITTPPATPSQTTLFGQTLKSLSNSDRVNAVISTPHRKFPRSVQFLVRKKMVQDRIIEIHGTLVFQLLEFMRAAGDLKIDLKTLNNVLMELKVEGSVNVVKMYFNKNVATKNLTFIYDANYTLESPIIKQIIGQIKDTNINMSLPVNNEEKEALEKHTIEDQHFYNKKVAIGYGMIQGQLLRTKGFHLFLFKYCASLYRGQQQPQQNDPINFNTYQLPTNQKIYFYVNSFLKSLTIGDYLRIMPQYVKIPGLTEKIQQGVKAVDLPIAMRCNIFTRHFMSRFIARVDDLTKLGAVKAFSTLHVNQVRKRHEFQLLPETTFKGKIYDLTTLKGIEQYWYDLETSAVGDTDVPELIEKFGDNIHSPQLWGLTFKAPRSTRRYIMEMFATLGRPLTMQEKVEISQKQRVRISYIDTLYKRYTESLNKKRIKLLTKGLPRRIGGNGLHKRAPAASASIIRSQKWSHSDDRRLLNFTIQVFTPFLKSLKTFDWTKITPGGVPLVDNPLWGQVSTEFERSVHRCHHRVVILLKKYPSYKHKVFSLLPYHQKRESYSLVIPDTIQQFNEQYEFKENARTHRDVWEHAKFNLGNSLRLRDKVVYVVSLPDASFDSQVGKDILLDKDTHDVISILNQLLMDRQIIRIAKRSKSRRYVAPIFTFIKPCEGEIFFDECKQLLKVFSKHEDGSFFRFEPYSSGGTVAEAIHLMVNNRLLPSVFVNHSIADEMKRPASRQTSTGQSLPTPTGKCEVLIDQIDIGFYRSSMNDSYCNPIKRALDDEEYVKEEGRFLELIDEDGDEERDKQFTKEPIETVDEDIEVAYKKQKQQGDKEISTDKTSSSFKQLVEEYCKKELERDEMRKIFYLGAMNLQDSCDSPQEELESKKLLNQVKEMESIWNRIQSSGVDGIDLIQLCKFLIQLRGDNHSDQENNGIVVDINKNYGVVASVKDYISTLRSFNYIQQLYGYSQIIYVDTLSVTDMMLPPTSHHGHGANTNNTIEFVKDTQSIYSKSIIRPWRNVDGTINAEYFNAMIHDIIMYLMAQPGAQLLHLSYKIKIPPTLLSLIMSALSELGYVKVQWFRHKKPSLFSKQTQTSFEIVPPPINILDSDYDPTSYLNQFYTPLPNIVNLDKHLSYLISLYNL